MERRDSECGARFDDVGFRRGIRPQCFHREPTEPGDVQSKVACFNEPITSVEHAKINHGDHDYRKVRVLFQSTSSRNVRCVNSLVENMLFARKKSCAMGDRKRMWVMDTNAKRQPCLSTYGRTDTIYWLMRERHLYVMSWNYWHGRWMDHSARPWTTRDGNAQSSESVETAGRRR